VKQQHQAGWRQLGREINVWVRSWVAVRRQLASLVSVMSEGGGVSRELSPLELRGASAPADVTLQRIIQAAGATGGFQQPLTVGQSAFPHAAAQCAPLHHECQSVICRVTRLILCVCPAARP
jgi:hypothetical protein